MGCGGWGLVVLGAGVVVGCGSVGGGVSTFLLRFVRTIRLHNTYHHLRF